SSTTRISSFMTGWNREAERRPVGGDGLDPDLATMGLDDGLADGEADARRVAAGAGPEGLEDVVDVDWVDALALVADGQPGPVAIPGRRHRDRSHPTASDA